MAEPLPQAQNSPQSPSEADYDAFCTTVMASARGRWFLAEYARRHRKADTDAVLSALHKIEDMVRTAPAAEPVARLRDELRALAAMVREARLDLTATGQSLSNAAKVMALLGLLEQRIEESLAPRDDRTPLPPPTEGAGPVTAAEPARGRLTVVAETPEPFAAPARVMPLLSPSAALLPSLDTADAGPNVVAIARTAVAARPQAATPVTGSLFPDCYVASRAAHSGGRAESAGRSVRRYHCAVGRREDCALYVSVRRRRSVC